MLSCCVWLILQCFILLLFLCFVCYFYCCCFWWRIKLRVNWQTAAERVCQSGIKTVLTRDTKLLLSNMAAPTRVGDYYVCGMVYVFGLIIIISYCALCRRLRVRRKHSTLPMRVLRGRFATSLVHCHVLFRVATDSGCLITVKLSVCTVQLLPDDRNDFASAAACTDTAEVLVALMTMPRRKWDELMRIYCCRRRLDYSRSLKTPTARCVTQLSLEMREFVNLLYFSATFFWKRIMSIP